MALTQFCDTARLMQQQHALMEQLVTRLAMEYSMKFEYEEEGFTTADGKMKTKVAMTCMCPL
jgi:hypothetical protein